MKPQRAQRTLCSQEEFPLKDITDKDNFLCYRGSQGVRSWVIREYL